VGNQYAVHELVEFERKGNMRMHDRSAHNIDPLTELKCEVETMRDPEHKNLTEHMIVVMAALEAGANVNRLVKRTGYNRKFIESIERRMRKAGLWVAELVDDQECLDLESPYGIFSHALVAQGTVTRIRNMNGGYVYLGLLALAVIIQSVRARQATGPLSRIRSQTPGR
jgi:hypothetical protein